MLKPCKVVIIIISLIGLCQSYSSPNCNSSSYYNILSLSCTTCPSNTIVSPLDNTYCNCSNTFYKNPSIIGFNYASSCLPITNFTYDNTTQILSLYDMDGMFNPKSISCASNAYPNTKRDGCVSCGYDAKMVYNTALNACQCTGNFIRVGQACYQNKFANWNRNFSITDKANYLAEQRVKIGCQQQNLPQPCNLLINMCVAAEYSSQNFFCKLLSTLSLSSNISSLPVYTFSSQLTDSIGIYASSKNGVNTTTIKNQLNVIVIQYDYNGAIQDVSPLNQQLFECSLTQEDIVDFASFGLNLYKSCSMKRTFSSSIFYDFYIQTSSGAYAQIPVLINQQYYKRINPSVSSSSHSFSLQFISQPPLLIPILSLSTSSSGRISTSSESSSISLSTLTAFIILNVFILICFVMVLYRHVQYNPSEEINDPYFLCRGAVTFFFKMCYVWSYGLWVWLFGLSMYMFTFYKFQETIFLILPDQNTQWAAYYFYFMLVYYIMLVITAFSVWKLTYDLTDVDYFMIDWEKQKDVRKFDVGPQRKAVSVWRKVLVVNELYQLAIRQNINIYFVTLMSLLFLNGLDWINLSYTIPNTSNLSDMSSTSSSQNVALSYFIITFVYFIIAVVQFTLRNIVRIWYPLPSQNFVDLCTVSNISILIFNEALHGYYIHGVNPMGQSQGNLNYIETMFQKESKSFGKSRSFHLQDPDHCQTFQAIFPLHIRRSFQIKYKSQFMQKLLPKNYQSNSIISNPLPDDLDESDYDQLEKISLNMVESFKMYLESIKTTLINLKDRSWWEKFLSMPITQDNIGKVPLFMKDKWNDFTNAFLSGHQFLILFNFINFVNMWYIITGNAYFSALLAIIVNQLFFRLPATFLIKRNISKNTLIDQRFFS